LNEPLDYAEQPGIVEQQVRRHRDGGVAMAADRIGQEWPVALVFNGISHAVMMCTPRDLEAFAVGFAISEGIVERGSDIHDIEVTMRADAAPFPYAQVDLTVVQQAFVALKERRRALTGRTGCGVCGIESIDLLDLAPERVPDTGFLARLAPDAIARAARTLPEHQALTKVRRRRDDPPRVRGCRASQRARQAHRPARPRARRYDRWFRFPFKPRQL
jgi:FdhD protein